jgi:hypothetical protein
LNEHVCNAGTGEGGLSPCPRKHVENRRRPSRGRIESAAVAEEHDSIFLELASGVVPLPLDVRQQLLMGLGTESEIPLGIREEFAAAGTTRPVELTDMQKAYLLDVIERSPIGGTDGLPDEIVALRNGLVEDLHGTDDPRLS